MSGLLHDRKSNFEKKTALHIYAIKIIFTTKNGWGCNRLVVCEHMDATDSAYSLNLYKTPLSQYPTARKRVSWGKFPLKRDRSPPPSGHYTCSHFNPKRDTEIFPCTIKLQDDYILSQLLSHGHHKYYTKCIIIHKLLFL